MSRYKRDDQQFREQVARLADAGLNLDRTQQVNQATSITIAGAPMGQNLYGARTTVNSMPTVPTSSKASELICGIVAYSALAVAVALSIKYIILPIWGAL